MKSISNGLKMPLIKVEKPLIVVVGPTAVGKTEFSIQLAEKLNGEIISADSRTFYKGMDIGTAKPTPDQLLRVPHHLINVLEPSETWSLALFQKEVHQIIQDIHCRGKVPIMVGGTGQYIRAILEGWSLPNVPPNEGLRAVLNEWADQIGRDGLHQRLSLIDPAAANKIEAENLRRTVRAFEVIFSTGRRFSDQYLKNDIEYPYIILGLTRDRGDLYNRIDMRIDNMLKDGFVEEVRGLLDQGNSPGLSSFSAIGYPQIIQFLKGDLTLDAAIESIKKNSREFVRRQSNWFKASDKNIHWINASDKYMLNNALKFIQDSTFWTLPKGSK
jgi:tRNA dimethylallyltransferase